MAQWRKTYHGQQFAPTTNQGVGSPAYIYNIKETSLEALATPSVAESVMTENAGWRY